MPTVLRVGPYRFFFYAADCVEPPHVHVERDSNKAKFWLKPVRLHSSNGFSTNELNRIQRIIEENLETLLQKWEKFCHD